MPLGPDRYLRLADLTSTLLMLPMLYLLGWALAVGLLSRLFIGRWGIAARSRKFNPAKPPGYFDAFYREPRQ